MIHADQKKKRMIHIHSVYESVHVSLNYSFSFMDRVSCIMSFFIHNSCRGYVVKFKRRGGKAQQVQTIRGQGELFPLQRIYGPLEGEEI